MNSGSVLSGVAESASYNILLQVFFRIQTFALNGFILRYISKDVLGIINVRIFLLYSSITFISTEAFKNACITNPNHQKWQQIINLIWLTVPTCIICSLVLGYVWLTFLEQPSPQWLGQYTIAVFVVGFCAVTERFAEPLLVVASVFMFNKLRALCQCISVASQCVIVAIYVYQRPEHAIYGFCVGQIVRSLMCVVILYGYFMYHLQNNTIGPLNSITDFLPKRLAQQPIFSAEHSALTYSFFKQGILKQLLTEGERYMMTVFNILNFGEQGVYDVVSNLGSLTARFIFRPVEESGYQFFAQTIERNKLLRKQNPMAIETAAKVLQHLLKVMFLIGSIAVVFGYAYSYLVLQLYGGEILTSGSGPILLRWHCVYVLFIALNGVSESYTFATMGKHDIDSFNFIMIFISAIFLAAAWYLTRLFGGVGFILANCANMAFRIFHSTCFINKSFSNTRYRPLSGVIPHISVAITLVLSWGITTMSEIYFCCSKGLIYILLHVFIGAVCLAVVLIMVFVTERELVQFIVQNWKRRKLREENDDADFVNKLD